MKEGDRGDDRYSSISNKAAHPGRRTIRERNNGQLCMEEGHTRIKVQEAFYKQTSGWYPTPTRDGSKLRLTR